MEQLSERKYGRNIGLRFKLDLLFARNAATPKTRLGAGRDQMPTSEALLQSGVRTLSVAPSLVAVVKAAVRTSRCEVKTFTDSRRSIRSPFRNAVTAVDDPQ